VRYEWDDVKDRNNQKGHDVSFREAAEIFNDPLHLSILDHRFSYFQERWITVGQGGDCP